MRNITGEFPKRLRRLREKKRISRRVRWLGTNGGSGVLALKRMPPDIQQKLFGGRR